MSIFLIDMKDSRRKMNNTSHCFYWSFCCFAEIRSEDIKTCFGLSTGVSFGKDGLDVGASVSYSQCDKKKLLDEGTLGR